MKLQMLLSYSNRSLSDTVCIKTEQAKIQVFLPETIFVMSAIFILSIYLFLTLPNYTLFRSIGLISGIFSP